MFTFYTYKSPNTIAISEYLLKNRLKNVSLIALISMNMIEVLNSDKENDYSTLYRLYNIILKTNFITLVQTFENHYEIVFVTE